MVEQADGILNGNFAEGLRSLSPGSPARLDLAIQLLDVRAGAFVKLVDDIEHQKAFMVVLQEITLMTWSEFANFPFKDANLQSPDMQLCWERIGARVSYWKVEGFRRLAAKLAIPTTILAPSLSRRGYRSEVQSWMNEKQITTIALAAKRLAVSPDTLKSIMSSKGRARYSPETLSLVLEKIGLKVTE